MDKSSHIPDRDLMMSADGELSPRRAGQVREHLEACWACRTRMKEIEETISEFMDAHQSTIDTPLPPMPSSRAALEAGLRELAQESHPVSRWRWLAYAGCAAAFFLMMGALVQQFLQSGREASLLPNSKLTPGVTRAVSKADLCSPESSRRPRFISAAKGLTVFEEYGIGDPHPAGYELDYLIDPELGGSDDVRNLWPQPYSAVWSARVKDALEEHLHEMVCAGQVTLPEAQHDISTDWIATYKKYFHTDSPVVAHLAFIKDEPWKN